MRMGEMRPHGLNQYPAFITSKRSVSMPPEVSHKASTKGETMDERFSGYLKSKQAGVLSCPICGQTNTFESRGNVAATRAYPSVSPTPQFNYAACTNCGYSIFFDAQTTGLLHNLAPLEED
jgi:predicted nucleic-acid-binding Zn-ribbon protein